MCSNPITFFQALTKTLNELLYTLNCHLIVPKHCHKSKWSKPSSTEIKNTTLVTFWKHKLKNAYCHLLPGEGSLLSAQGTNGREALAPQCLGADICQPVPRPVFLYLTMLHLPHFETVWGAPLPGETASHQPRASITHMCLFREEVMAVLSQKSVIKPHLGLVWWWA